MSNLTNYDLLRIYVSRWSTLRLQNLNFPPVTTWKITKKCKQTQSNGRQLVLSDTIWLLRQTETQTEVRAQRGKGRELYSVRVEAWNDPSPCQSFEWSIATYPKTRLDLVGNALIYMLIKCKFQTICRSIFFFYEKVCILDKTRKGKWFLLRGYIDFNQWL